MGARTGEEFLKGLKARKREVWLGDERVDDVVDHPAFSRRRASAGRGVRPAARVPRRLPDARSRDGRADQREPHDPPLGRRPEATAQGARAHRRGVGRPHGPHARLHERDLRRLRGRAQCLARPRRRQRGGPRQPRAASRSSSPAKTSRSRTRSCTRRSTGRPTTSSPATRCRCTRSATPSTASSCAARASSRRSRRSPTRSRCTPAIRCRLTRRPSTP